VYYFGFFKDLLDLNISDSASYDLYERALAGYYDKMFQNDLFDIEIYLKNASVLGGEVLELACGSGRVTLALAEKGFRVTGIDLSPDMLGILKEKLAKAPRRIRERITTYQCDMTDFSLAQRFKLAILPATSISLLLSDEQIMSLFRCVHRHLEIGGRFIFDYRVSDYIIRNTDLGKTHCYTWDHDDKKEFVLFAEIVDYSKLQTVTNFYAELIEDRETKRVFGSTVKRLVNDDVVDLARAENFKLIDTSLLEYSSNEASKFVILEKR